MGACGTRPACSSSLDQWCVAWALAEYMVPLPGSHHVGHWHVCIFILTRAVVLGHAARIFWPEPTAAKLLEHEYGVASRSL